MNFKLTHTDPSTRARAGILQTGHGEIETPVFMPVGTQATVKSLSPDELKSTGSQIILNNTYHLFLRPGPDLFVRARGTHRFSSWDRPVLTDSGGYQVFSLSDLNQVTDEGVRFQSHLDGSYHMFTPESTVDVQKKIGADIIMPLDVPVEYPVEKIRAQSANRMTLDWLKRCCTEFDSNDGYHNYAQAMFGIIQGSMYSDLRKYAVEATIEFDLPGYAIGGLSVGEPKDLLYGLTEVCTEYMPKDRPRYLMGVGKPEDLVECIGLGIDMFDCVLPTRVGRNGWLYTETGRIIIKNTDHIDEFFPVEENCNCYTCRNFTRSYLRHLFMTGEMLGPRLASLHNVAFYNNLVGRAREAVMQGRYREFKKEFYSVYNILNQ